MPIPQKPFGDQPDTGAVEFISERHVACVFLLDTSGSMNAPNGDPIRKLNQGLKTFKEQTISDSTFDEHTKACIDVALISFGPDVVIQRNFVPVSKMDPPELAASGGTPLGQALNKALDLIEERKKRYSDLGTPYFRPWIFCITDGEPTDDYLAAAKRLKDMEQRKKVLGYFVGVGTYNKGVMAEIFDKERLFELDNLNFTDLFKFVSSSLASVRNSDPNAGNAVAVDATSDLHKITVTF